MESPGYTSNKIFHEKNKFLVAITSQVKQDLTAFIQNTDGYFRSLNCDFQSSNEAYEKALSFYTNKIENLQILKQSSLETLKSLKNSINQEKNKQLLCNTLLLEKIPESRNEPIEDTHKKFLQILSSFNHVMKFFEEGLGLTIKSESQVFTFTFKNLISNSKSLHTISLQMLDDGEVAIKSCSPHLKKADEIADMFRLNHDLCQFLKAIRMEFKNLYI